ncbi:L,D-transpeptidase [Chloracidobacterium sp. E]|uniref:L,D-transpeptidase n=2 Tax=Chloracidobacterium TaxID=458032 RepID=A0ABX8B6Y1_9BACT|nr:L,D-transpeptidase [Chloracidobacterium sp. 2]QUV89758.1 L,D-transpeptidase [Chloracidobacterium sp. S]QUV92848.1 L,D-transpeptidase [Chloracidobacterium sp. A]QUV95812.1 L,D-transpeptidase [Chloracidobacterium sp. N]QUV98888.1 L,D-transpeptidase [Chloracidobacterium sp. E]
MLAESAALPPQTTPAPEAGERLWAAAVQSGVPFPLRAVSLRVYKSLRRLELWSGQTCVRTYTVALGAEPEQDKLREGDHRTPVGRFYVCTRNDRSRFHLFLGLSYPNEEDAERGLRDGLISRRQYRAIRQAQRQQVRPPWNTPLGGEVGIHGGGTGSDWTWGCVALSNDDIEELWLACPLKTPVTIYP